MPINYSIVIPHKNIPDLLVRCIRSIPERDDIQVIVVDDNSDDADVYLEKYPELSRPDTEVHFTKEGKGAGYARNVGLRYVKGKWVLFADADDFFLPNWTITIDQYLESDADIVLFRIGDITSHSDCLWYNQALVDYSSGRKSARDVLFARITCWAKMLRTDFLRQNNILFEEIECANDVAFGYQIAVQANDIIISPSAIYDVTYREGSLTTIKNREYFWLRYTTVKDANAYAFKHGFKQFEYPYVIDALKQWRQLGLSDFFYFLWHERHEVKRAFRLRLDKKAFNYRHPYLYVLLVLLKLV